MFYQLTFKISKERKNLESEIMESINRLHYKHVQQLNWTSGHFILESYENNLIKTLVAFPHVVKPDRELILIQEYILDRLGLDYETIKIVKWIQNRKDAALDVRFLEPNNLVIRNYHQEYFFRRILKIALEVNSLGIASEFFSNYYLDAIFIPYRTIDPESFNEIRSEIESLTQRFERIYCQAKNSELPIFIINEQNKLRFEFLQELVIKKVKGAYNIELNKCIITRIRNDTFCSEIDNLHTIPFSNSVVGQIWNISIDYGQNNSNLIEELIKNNLVPVVLNNRLHTLIIIWNPKLLAISAWLKKDCFIII